MRTPLKTRPGVAHAPIEPGERCLRSTPWLLFKPEKPCRFITPAKPLPLVRPVTSMTWPGANASTVTSWPRVYSLASVVRSSTRCRRGATSAFAKWPVFGLFTLRGSIAPYASWTALYPSRSAVRTWVTTHGPACNTVTGTTRLLSHTWVMPSFAPRMPLTCLSMVRSLQLALDVDACRQVEPHQRVDRLRRRIDDVDQTLVGAHLEVFARVLVLVRRADHAVAVDLRRQRHRARDLCPGTRHRLHDLASRGVDDLVVIGLEPDADLLSRHGGFCFLLSMPLCASPDGSC